ncbi:MAG: Flp pilus assembly protein CpaB [Candidatus Electrothrix sp. ATG2]|nr:Flp pilus assembly protein CpaB [Candidatus Electrothrix sp. ATG2]
MEKSGRILFLIIALAAASYLSFIVYQRTGTQPGGSKKGPQQNVVEIAVAGKAILKGAKIKEEDVRMVTYLKDTVPGGHFTDRDEVVDRIAITSVQETEPLLESALAPLDRTKGGMAAVITEQKRAMSIKVNNVIGIAGFLHPGHLVDVLVSMQKPAEKGEKKIQVTKTVLENIPVLAVGTQLQETEEKGAKKVTVATLEVDLEQAEKLALAVNQGTIQLVLRSYADTDEVLTKGATVAALLKSYATESEEPVRVVVKEVIKEVVVPAEPVPQPVARKKTRKKGMVIEVMNGNNVQQLTLQ